MRQLQRARNAARRVLDQQGVRSAPIPIEKIAVEYATIMSRSLRDEVSGMLIPVDGGWVIVVNRDESPVRQRFTLAHELGHLVLRHYTAPHADRRYRVRFRDKESAKGSVFEEIEANQFAAALLMPQDLLTAKLLEVGFEYHPDDEESSQLKEVARHFRVSTQALSIRLSALQLL
jgi:Zn-dependent peptidase ImmA (M78 family)